MRIYVSNANELEIAERLVKENNIDAEIYKQPPLLELGHIEGVAIANNFNESEIDVEISDHEFTHVVGTFTNVEDAKKHAEHVCFLYDVPLSKIEVNVH